LGSPFKAGFENVVSYEIEVGVLLKHNSDFDVLSAKNGSSSKAPLQRQPWFGVTAQGICFYYRIIL